MRIAVVGGHGKTGRALGAALARRGHDAVALGRADWPALADAMAGCDAAYLIAPNMHPDEATYVGAAVEAVRSGGDRPRRAALGRRAVRPGDAAPPRQGRGRGRRTP